MSLKPLLLILILSQILATLAQGKFIVLEGDLADQYVGHDSNGTGYEHAAVVLNQDTGMIESIETETAKIRALKDKSDSIFISLQDTTTGQFDVIYPGLIDLHNHTKQNNLAIWKEAHGQFANRFEWRAWGNYKKAVSNNMNPWIGYGTPISCAAFRWSELQAMVVGTTYLQGPSYCVDNFAIHQVEGSGAFPRSKKDNVQAPTDLVIPNDMVFVWKTLKPIIDQGASYEQAMAQVINEYCHADKLLGRPYTATDVLSDEGIDVLRDRDKLEAACTKKVPLEELPDKFIRYIYWVHKSIASKRQYAEEIASGNGSAIIAHLAEGRRDDPYNQKEYEIVKLLGMNKKGVNFVHGVGISEQGLEDMAAKQMGLIWSPFSNLLLYSQTLDIKMAVEKGVMLALGSDWLPTGSKGPLEELKVAIEYLQTQNLTEAVAKMPGAEGSVYRALFKMVTENPAKMINHWQGTSGDPWENNESEGGVATIAPKAMGSLIVTKKFDGMDPYKNLVVDVWEKDINLVVVDSKVIYGNESYVREITTDYELMAENPEFGMAQLLDDNDAPVLFARNPKPKKQEELEFLAELSAYITDKAQAGRVDHAIQCAFTEPKVFVHQFTMNEEDDLKTFKESSGMNLDRFIDIQRLLGVSLTTQSRNLNDPERGDKAFAIGGDPEVASQDFTPLYSCNDSYHSQRIRNFISETWPVDRANRPETFSSKPERMAEDYN